MNEIIESNRQYIGEISIRVDKFNLNGKIVQKEIVEHAPSVGIIPFINANEIILVKQYRLAANETLIEIPAGKIEKGESVEQAAAREMAEETGFKGKIIPLTRIYLAPGYDTELMNVFIATDLEKVTTSEMDEDEEIETIKLPFEESIRMCMSGEIADSKTIASLLTYQNKKRYEG